MNTSWKLKIWTIITHGLIFIGAGHGISILFFFELTAFPFIGRGNFGYWFNGIEEQFTEAGLPMFVGQIMLIASNYIRQDGLRLLFQIVGLGLLWLNLVYFMYGTYGDYYFQIAYFTVIPFAICTLAAFIGKPLKELLNLINKWMSR